MLICDTASRAWRHLVMEFCEHGGADLTIAIVLLKKFSKLIH